MMSKVIRVVESRVARQRREVAACKRRVLEHRESVRQLRCTHARYRDAARSAVAERGATQSAEHLSELAAQAADYVLRRESTEQLIGKLEQETTTAERSLTAAVAELARLETKTDALRQTAASRQRRADRRRAARELV